MHSRNEAMQQHCKHENDSVHWWYVCIWGREYLKKIAGVTRGCLVINPPPRTLRISRILSSNKEFFWGLPSSRRPKKWVFYISFYCGIFGTFSRLKICSLRCLSYIIALNRWFFIIKFYLAVTTYTKQKNGKKKGARTWDSKSYLSIIHL